MDRGPAAWARGARRAARSAGPYALAAVIPVLVMCALAVARAQFPFGPGSRGFNDLGNAYVPLHAQLHELLRGRAPGDLFLTWDAGLGAPFLPDYVVNLGGPFAPLVALFPREQVELGVYVVSLVKYAAAAVAMTWYLRSTYGGPRWPAAAFGAAWALCAWGFDDASYVPMWLDALVTLPLLLRAVEWVIARRPPWQPAAIVALAWWSNFYTAFMASMLAGLVLLVRVSTQGHSPLAALRAVGRACVAFAAGLALVSPLLVPAYLAAKGAQPAETGRFDPASWQSVVTRLLPGTEGVGTSPSLAPGTSLVLVLAVGLLAENRVRVRVRVAWALLVAFLLLSFQWPPTQAAWHGFDTPNGSRYREAFVLTAVLVVMAWQVARAGPLRPPVVVTGLAGLAACLAVAGDGGPILVDAPLRAWIVGAAVAGLLALGAFWLVRRGGRRAWAAVAVVGLLGVVAVEGTASHVRMDRLRAQRLSPQERRGALTDAMRAAVRQAEDGAGRPNRIDAVPVLGSNTTMLLGASGSSYYSNVVPSALSALVVATGGGWGALQRSVYAPPVEASDAALGIGLRLHGAEAPGGVPVVTRTERPAAPVVTFRPGARPAPDLGADPWVQQELLLGASVYETPAVTIRSDAGRRLRLQPDGTFHLGGHVDEPRVSTLTAGCRPGSRITLWAPALVGDARIGTAEPVALLSPGTRGPGTYSGAAMQELGVVPGDGIVRLTLTARRWSVLPGSPLGCLDEAALRRAVGALAASSPGEVRVGGHGFGTSVAAGAGGLVVAAVPLTPGWGCAVDGQARAAVSFHGLLAAEVPAGTHRVACAFQPPGLDAGLLAAPVAAVLLALGAAWGRYRRRRRARPAAGPPLEPPSGPVPAAAAAPAASRS